MKRAVEVQDGVDRFDDRFLIDVEHRVEVGRLAVRPSR